MFDDPSSPLPLRTPCPIPTHLKCSTITGTACLVWLTNFNSLANVWQSAKVHTDMKKTHKDAKGALADPVQK